VYALRRISIMNGRRFQCPAMSGTVGCPLRPGTVEVAIEGNLPLITTPPAAASAPTCCTQATVELKQDGQRKIWQKLYWGSKEYTLSYNRRTHVEGVFGNLKNPLYRERQSRELPHHRVGPGDPFPRYRCRSAQPAAIPQLASAAWAR
jgi:hypothetical protein